jgi:hypothetical protein
MDYKFFRRSNFLTFRDAVGVGDRLQLVRDLGATSSSSALFLAEYIA